MLYKFFHNLIDSSLKCWFAFVCLLFLSLTYFHCNRWPAMELALIEIDFLLLSKLLIKGLHLYTQFKCIKVWVVQCSFDIWFEHWRHKQFLALVIYRLIPSVNWYIKCRSLFINLCSFQTLLCFDSKTLILNEEKKTFVPKWNWTKLSGTSKEWSRNEVKEWSIIIIVIIRISIASSVSLIFWRQTSPHFG